MNIIEEINYLINEEIKNPLQGLTNEEIVLAIDGSPNDEDDYWQTDASLMNKCIKYINKFYEEFFSIEYYDGLVENNEKVGIQFNFDTGIINGTLNVYKDNPPKISVSLNSPYLILPQFEEVADTLNFLEKISKEIG